MITLTILFIICAITVLLRLLMFAIKASWGILKMLTSFLFFPIVLVGLVLNGMLSLAFILLIVVGIASLFAKN